MKRQVIIFCFLMFANVLTIVAQESIKGRVFDDETDEPMAFVNVVYNQNKEGLITDLDGFFQINNKSRVEFIRCSFVGYQTETYTIRADEDFIEIRLKPQATTLDEVTVFPGENPAHRIIYNAIENKYQHDPKNLKTYDYVAYSKMYFTVNLDSLTKKDIDVSETPESDTSSRARFTRFLEKHHLFMMESVTKKEFQSPDKHKEEILASRVSGLKHPSFTYLAAEFQSFSFYGEIIEVVQQEYISPLSQNSPNKYFFLIEDTAYNVSGDTTFIISFRPKRNTNFKALKGVLYLNTDGWAIQNVIAEPTAQTDAIKIRIQQQYEKPDGKHWFPVQLNTDFVFDMMQVADSEDESVSTGLIGVGKTYLQDIRINGVADKRIRGGSEVIIADNATKQDSLFWNQYRVQALDNRERNTYNLVDSLGEVHNFDRKMASVEILATGKIPWKFLNIDLTQLLWFNEYEGTRIGLGVETNKTLSNLFSVNTYAAYGFRDADFKYGAGLKVMPLKNDRIIVNALYKHDLRESDAYDFSKGQYSVESFRKLFISNMDWYNTLSLNLQSVLFRGFRAEAFLDFNEIHMNHRFRYPNGLNELERTGWETGLKLRWVIREDILRTPSGNIMSMGSKYPDLHLNLRKGIPWKDKNFDPYWRLEARYHDVIKTKWIGDFHVTMDAGLLFADTDVYGQNFLMHSSGRWLDADNSFATMYPGEFVADKFIALFFKYDIGSLLFHVKNWKPEFALVTNAVIGDYELPANYVHPLVLTNDYKIPQKGYVESGLQINAILKQFFLKYGVGAYYNYGPYTHPDFKKNFAIKLRLEYEF
jgi:hypothetical protein